MPKSVVYVIVAMLLLAVADLHPAYYILLRFVVTLFSICAAYISFCRGHRQISLVFCVAVILFNPFLYKKLVLSKFLWVCIDISYAVFLLSIKTKTIGVLYDKGFNEDGSRIEGGKFERESKDSKYILTKDINSLSTNEKLPWSEDFIEKYKDKWNWDMLSTNNGLPWSMHLLEKFEDQWVWFNKEQDMTASLWVNNTLWEKVFKPYVNDEMIEEVISGINIDSLNTPYNKTMLYNA